MYQLSWKVYQLSRWVYRLSPRVYPSRTQRKKGFFGGKQGGELWAVSETLNVAKKRVRMVDSPVRLFCDLLKALESIALHLTCQGNRFLQGIIYGNTQELQQNGYCSTFEWIPSHSSLIGNEKADQAARKRAEKGGKLTERGSSLAYVGSNVSEMRLNDVTKWHNTETENMETSRHGYYIPRMKGGISTILDSAPKKYTLWYY